MGTTEQLTLLSLTINLILDADTTKIGVCMLIQALSDAYKTACANPLLLGKVTLALMERADVKTEAIHQGLCLAVAEAFRRKSALLEPLAASLVESAIAETEEEAEVGDVRANGTFAKARSTHGTPSPASIATINDQVLPSPYLLRLPLTTDTSIILGRTRATRRRLARLSKDRNAFGDESHANQKLSMSSIGAKASLTQLADRLGALAVTSVLTPLLVCYRSQNAAKKSMTSPSGIRRNVPVTPEFSPSLAIQAHRIQTSSRSSSSSCNLEQHESDECSSMRTVSSDLKKSLAGKVEDQWLEGSSKFVEVTKAGSCL